MTSESRSEGDGATVEELQRMLESVRPYIRPVLAADLQERIWHDAERLRTLAHAARGALPPLVMRPRTLPAALHPSFFVPKHSIHGPPRS